MLVIESGNVDAGNGITGMMIPGCPETYESGSQQFQVVEDERIREQGSRKIGMRGGRFQDQHQKIRHFREGDILAMPAGVSHWAYNNGDQPLVAVILIDTANHANQLDKNFPKVSFLFWLMSRSCLIND